MIMLMRTPRTVDLELTSRCNQRCRYCYYFDNDDVTYRDMPTQRWLDLFDEMGRATVLDVCLSGGEALLRPDFFELLDGILRNNMRFQLLTNGRLVTPEIARHLKATSRCNSVQISLDAAEPFGHEIMRGPGTFEPALQAIKTLKAIGLPVTVRCTVHAHNIEGLPALAKLLLEEIGLPSFSTNAISSLGTQAKYGQDLFLTAAKRLQAMQVLGELDKRYPGRIEASAGPLAEWKTFHDMEAARRANLSLPDRRGHLSACGCIYTRLAVRADGAYIPCVMLAGMVLGWVGEDSLVEVWQNSEALNKLRARIEIPLSRFSRCADCDYMDLCTGNCPGTALSACGDPNQPAEEACLRLFQAALAEADLSLW